MMEGDIVYGSLWVQRWVAPQEYGTILDVYQVRYVYP